MLENQEIPVLLQNVKAQPAQADYEAFLHKSAQRTGELLSFGGVNGADVYNPSIPFTSGGQTVIAGRVQGRTEGISKTVFFAEESDGIWRPIADAPVFTLEDPFITHIGGEIILGGVALVWEGERIKHWVTEFYRGADIYHLRKFAEGPTHMKDVRLCALPNGIAVCSRPQGEKVIQSSGYLAKIGFTVIPSLEALTPEVIENAPPLEEMFLPKEWGGANQLHALSNGLVGVIGHKSWGEYKDGVHFLHYYSMAFAVDPLTRAFTQPELICARSCFPGEDSREPRLYDVTFTSGLIRNGDGTAWLYTGLSDSHVGRIRLSDPLCPYENIKQ